MDAVELDEIDAACPLLGLAVDRYTRYTFPHPGHRCRAISPPALIDPWRQTANCLGPGFPDCERYAAWQAESTDASLSSASAKPPAAPTAPPEAVAPGKLARPRRSKANPPASEVTKPPAAPTAPPEAVAPGKLARPRRSKAE